MDQARLNPDTLCVGIDSSSDAMIDISRRAAAKPSRGGVSNTLFICSSLEQLQASIDLRKVTLLHGESPVRTTWGQKLTKASNRKVLMLQGFVI